MTAYKKEAYNGSRVCYEVAQDIRNGVKEDLQRFGRLSPELVQIFRLIARIDALCHKR